MNSKKKSLAVVTSLVLLSGSAFADFASSFTAGRKAVAGKEYDAAITQFEEAAKLTRIPGQRYQAYYAIAEAWRVKGDWGKAEATIERILNDKEIPDANRMSAQVSLGNYKLQQKKVDEAIAAYQKAADYKVDNSEFHYAMLSCGNLLGQQKKYDEALKCYQTLLDNPKVDAKRRTRAQIGKGSVLFELKKYQEAVDALKDVAADTKQDAATRADALTVISRAQYKLGAFKESCKSSEAVIALNGIPAYFKAAAYMQAINIYVGVLYDYPPAKKMLDEFEKMPGLKPNQKKWIETYRARISKAEHTL